MKAKTSELCNREVQVIGRIWLPIKGCSHFNYSSLSTQEIQDLLAQVVEQAAVSTPGNHVVFRCKIGKHNNNLHVVTLRVPDPDNSQRSVTNLWVFLDPMQKITLSQLEDFAKSVILPKNTAEFEASVAWVLDRSPLRQQDITPVETDPTKNWQNLIVAVTTITTIALIAFFIAFMVTRQRIGDPSQTHDEPRKLAKFDSRWEAPEIREAIRAELQSRNLVDTVPDAELIDAFVGMFRLTDTQLKLTDDDRRAIEVRRQQKPPHPFIDFLDQFPEKLPIVSVTAMSWSQLCEAKLRPLAKHFRSIIEEGNDMGQKLDEMNPQEILEGLRDRLSYEAFYENWQKQNELRKSDPYVQTWQDPANESWQTKIRKFLQSIK